MTLIQTEPKKIYIGSTPVSKVYVGSTKVRPMPIGYDIDISNLKSQQSYSLQYGSSGSAFSMDGKSFYIGGTTYIYHYKLTKAYDLSTAVLSYSLLLPTQTSTPDVMQVYISPDGTKFAYARHYGGIGLYTLTTPRELSTATSLQTYTNISYPTGIWFKPDGTRVYISLYNGNANMRQYDLSTAWNISLGAASGNGVGSRLYCVSLSQDGTKLISNVHSGTDWGGRQYTLSTAWDITTASLSKSGGIGDMNTMSLDESHLMNVTSVGEFYPIYA